MPNTPVKGLFAVQHSGFKHKLVNRKRVDASLPYRTARALMAHLPELCWPLCANEQTSL